MKNPELEIQKKAIPVFQRLKAETERLSERTEKLEIHVSKKLIASINANQNYPEKLTTQEIEWDAINNQRIIHRWLYDLFVQHRDLYGYFEYYGEMYNTIKTVRDLAITKENYDIAETMTKWFNELPNP